MSMAETTWATAVTSIRPNEIRVRGYRLDELMGRISFGEAVYLVLRGELPGAAVGRLMEAMLVASIDHGVTPPSTLAVRNAATTGAALNACIASGALAVNKHHGGAVEECMRLLARGAGKVQAGDSAVAAAQAVIAEEKTAGRRMPGFGHRIHSDDPRSHRLLQLGREAGAAGPHIAVAEAIVRELAATGKALPLNVDGAIAALLADLGFHPDLANGFFILARTAGWMAQVLEERQREKPMRRIDQNAAAYDGPPPRELPKRR
jgi:citrate synthase